MLDFIILIYTQYVNWDSVCYSIHWTYSKVWKQYFPWRCYHFSLVLSTTPIVLLLFNINNQRITLQSLIPFLPHSHFISLTHTHTKCHSARRWKQVFSQLSEESPPRIYLVGLYNRKYQIKYGKTKKYVLKTIKMTISPEV